MNIVEASFDATARQMTKCQTAIKLGREWGGSFVATTFYILQTAFKSQWWAALAANSWIKIFISPNNGHNRVVHF